MQDHDPTTNAVITPNHSRGVPCATDPEEGVNLADQPQQKTPGMNDQEFISELYR